MRVRTSVVWNVLGLRVRGSFRSFRLSSGKQLMSLDSGRFWARVRDLSGTDK